ncbi:pirin family protein [Chitinophaga filiformis]|uniref:pirin family protein n=1 Tax=Chitinophaga filiformis TaxID=104663 RepID=UPI001F28FBEB|nr:pirin family protein [Chitinophaga filiformis]MCF6406461.1 pirin family protein [Chitinophaga filiformis]
MEKALLATLEGRNAKVGALSINHLFPNRYVHAIGPFVLVDQICPAGNVPGDPPSEAGKHAHPHRGVATFSYILEGEMEYADSYGNRATAKAGDAHWLMSGKGILHEEIPPNTPQGHSLHAVQWWINLPATVKGDTPVYMFLDQSHFPEIMLPDAAGTAKILIGQIGNDTSPVPVYNNHFICHLRLHPGAKYTMPVEKRYEYAVFVPSGEAIVNGQKQGASRLSVFDFGGDEIAFHNEAARATDILLFGGASQNEPFVTQGPFVMNNREEIADAYRDFFDGKYGSITYSYNA